MPESDKEFDVPRVGESGPEPEDAAPTDIAGRVFKEAVRKDPQNAGKHCKLADFYKKQKEYDLAETEYKKAVQFDPRNDIYHWSIGQFYEYETGKLILAESAYKEALRLAPNNPHNRLCLGRSYEKQGKLALAESEYRILAEASPAYSDLVARVCEKLGRTDAAIDEYNRASQKPNGVARAEGSGKRRLRILLKLTIVAVLAVMAASILMVHKYRQEAGDYAAKLNEAGDQKADMAAMKTKVSTMTRKLMETTSERDNLKKSEEISKRIISASEAALMGSDSEAIEELRAVLEKDPENASAHLWLGRVYAQTGRTDEAKDAYLNAARLGSEIADRALKRLEIGEKAAAVKSDGETVGAPEDGEPKVRSKEKADLARITEAYEKSFLGKVGGVTRIKESDCLVATKDDILNFVTALKSYEKREGFSDSGIFISGLINNLPADVDLELDLTHLEEPLHYVGSLMHSRDLRVNGNVGLFLGRSMESGSIVLEGNAGNCAGRSLAGGEIQIKGNSGESVGYFMKSGLVIVEGSSGPKTGDWMEGGELVVKGKAGDLVGSNMVGGRITLESDYSSLSQKIGGGQIFHRGVQIHP